MATITITDSLDVANKYDILVKQSLSGDSAYIRAKETIQELVSTGALDETQKAEIISNILGNVINNITSSSMSTAMQWANAEKEIALKKLELSKQLDILGEEYLLKKAQTAQVQSATTLAKIESKRIFGTAILDSEGNVVSLADDGKVYTDIQLASSTINKTDVEKTLAEQKIVESQAAVHKIVADTYTNYGHFTYTDITANGISGVTPNDLGTFRTLSKTQQDIAVEQAKGYVYNAWANALSGSASMLGTAIAAEYAEFGDGQPGGVLLDTILDAARNLKNAATTTDDAVPGAY
jgi:hypothetical protein